MEKQIHHSSLKFTATSQCAKNSYCILCDLASNYYKVEHAHLDKDVIDCLSIDLSVSKQRISQSIYHCHGSTVNCILQLSAGAWKLNSLPLPNRQNVWTVGVRSPGDLWMLFAFLKWSLMCVAVVWWRTPCSWKTLVLAVNPLPLL